MSYYQSSMNDRNISWNRFVPKVQEIEAVVSLWKSLVFYRLQQNIHGELSQFNGICERVEHQILRDMGKAIVFQTN